MYYPLFIDLKNKKILIIGGGKVGSRRAGYLLHAGASVTVISKEFNKKLSIIKNKKLKLIKKDVNKCKINFEDYFLVVIATNDKKINAKITKKIKETLICRADKHTDGDVVFPAVAKGNTVAFTTFGKDPKLSKKIKELLKKRRG